jgi:hypothetical protein
MWGELGIDPCDDPKAIRRAYAARLKTLDPDRDPAAFARLREALEWALAAAAADKQTFQLPRDQRAPESEAEQGDDEEYSLPVRSTEDEHEALADWSSSDRSAAAEDGEDKTFDESQLGAAERALLESIEAALARCDAGEAAKLYYRAAAIGAVPLQGAPRVLDRLFAIAVDDRLIDREAFRQLACTLGWDKPAREDDRSELRQRVLAKLAAEDWYDSLLAAADRRGRAWRKQAKLARLLLGRIGRFRLPRVDRAALKILLDEYRKHEAWLRDRIDPAWANILERRWRRREIVSHVFFILFLAAFLINGVRLFAVEAAAGTLSVWMLVLGACSAAFLLWLLRLLVTGLRKLLKSPSKVSEAAPPNDPDERLGWLERQAELAYEAMFDAPGGSPLAARYNDAKEFLHEAIALAYRLGHANTAERLSQRLAEIKATYRSQFPA